MHNAIMTTEITIDSAGRVVIPKNVREELRLEAGDKLELHSNGDEISMRPVRSAPSLVKVDGIWVHRGGEKITNEDVNRLLQEDRERRFDEYLR